MRVVPGQQDVADRIDIPHQWERIDLDEIRGTVMVIGAPDVGKSTFAQYLYRQLRSGGVHAAFLDGDPGQSVLGPPTTMTLAFEAGKPVDQSNLPPENSFPPQLNYLRSFVGSTTPRGHMLPVLVGAQRLLQAAYQAQVETVIYDTSGLVEPSQGGLTLKFSIIDLVRPNLVFAIQREQELEPILAPLRRTRRTRLIELHPTEAVLRRSSPRRQSHRAEQYARYFNGAQPLQVDWTSLAVFPKLGFVQGRLLAFEDVQGFVLGLGIVQMIQQNPRGIIVQTPLRTTDKVDALVLGDILIETGTYRDVMI